MNGWAQRLMALMMLLSTPSWAFAGAPALSIQLELVKKQKYFHYKEPVLMRLVVTSESDSDILITERFSNEIRNFYQDLLIINPEHRRLGVLRPKHKEEVPDAPPVPVLFRDGRHVRVVPYEKLPRSWEGEKSKAVNLRRVAPLEVSGRYLAQFQTSAMTFKAGDPGNILNYEWQGLLKSDIVTFCVEGAKKFHVIPDRWQLSWAYRGKETPEVQVLIWPKEGTTASDYQPKTISLNNVKAKKVEASDCEIRVFFDASEVVKSLGDVKVGRMYPVGIKGRLATGQTFGGETRVEVVR